MYVISKNNYSLFSNINISARSFYLNCYCPSYSLNAIYIANVSEKSYKKVNIERNKSSNFHFIMPIRERDFQNSIYSKFYKKCTKNPATIMQINQFYPLILQL